MEPLVLLLVAVTAVATSVLSAVAGLGGGVILLVVLAQVFAPTVAIPIQGAIQVVSNGSRATLLRRDVDPAVVVRTAVLLLPASLLGVAVATSLPEDVMRLVLGAFVLVLGWRPDRLRMRGRTGTGALVAVGAASGFLNTTVGASGPFTSPFLRAATATHVAFVATAATSQVLAHVAKLVAFGLEGFDLLDHADVVAVGGLGVALGSWIGTKLLGRIDDARLDLCFRIVLTALALRLVVTALT